MGHPVLPEKRTGFGELPVHQGVRGEHLDSCEEGDVGEKPAGVVEGSIDLQPVRNNFV